MNKTKENILKISKALFNQKGLTNVSQRDITKSLKISPGNLTYHFKKKEDLIEALYFEFIDLIEVEIKSFLKKDINLASFHQLIKNWFAYIYDYRFLFIDITNLTRMSPTIRQNYQQFVAVRASIFMKIIHQLIHLEILRSEELENEYQDLYQRLHIISDFYLSTKSIFAHKVNKAQQLKHQQLFFSALYPYLTTKGKKAYGQLFE